MNLVKNLFLAAIILLFVSCDLDRERRLAEQRQRQQEIAYQNSLPSQIEFCERVDDKLMCINTSIEFTRGVVTARFQKLEPIKTSYIYVTVFVMNGLVETIFDKGTFESNPDWSVCAFPINFVQRGIYKVVVRNPSSEKLAEGIVTIR